MKLNETRKPLFPLVRKILPYVAPYGLLSIMALSTVLGEAFYQLRPQALILCLPIFITLTTLILHWNKKSDQQVDCAYEATKNNPPPYPQSKVLHFERNICLLIYFISDIITSFELFSILTLAMFSFNALHVYSFIFPISIFYALYIHTLCRYPEMKHQYLKFETIMHDKPPRMPVNMIKASMSTFFCFITSIALWNYLVPSLFFFIMGCFCGLYYLKQNAYTTISLGTFYSSLQRLQHFNYLLAHQLRIFNLYAPLPTVAHVTHLAANSIALLYAGACLYSGERTMYIERHYPPKKEPIIPDVSRPTKTYPWISVLARHWGSYG